LLIWSVFLAMANAACPASANFSEVSSAMTQALDSFQQGDFEGFVAQATDARAQLPCIDEILLPENVSEVHRFEAYYSYGVGDADRLESALSGWLSHRGFDVVMSEVGTTDLADALIHVQESGPSLLSPFIVKETGTEVYLDGARSQERPIQRGLVVQRSGADGRVMSTEYVHAGQALGLPLVEPGRDRAAFGRLEWKGGRPYQGEQLDCGAVDLSLMSHIDAALDAFSKMNSEAFSVSATKVEQAAKCAPMAVGSGAVAGIFRIRGLHRFVQGDRAGALRNFHSAALLQPAYSLPSSIAAPDSELDRLYRLAQERPNPVRLPIQPPSKSSVLVNGQRVQSYLAHAPNLIQVLDRKSTLTMTLLLEPGQRLPPPFPSVQEGGVEEQSVSTRDSTVRHLGNLVGIRGTFLYGAYGRYYAEGLTGELDTGIVQWTGYGTGFRSDEVSRMTGGLGVQFSRSMEFLDTGLAVDVLPAIAHNAELSSFQKHPDEFWYREEVRLDKQGVVFGVLVEAFARARFRVSRNVDVGGVGQLGIGVFGPMLPATSEAPQCEGQEDCPIGDLGALSMNFGAGPSVTVHLPKRIRLTVDAPVSALVQLDRARLSSDVLGMEVAQSQSVQEEVCNASRADCLDGATRVSNGGDWNNNAFGFEALGKGYSSVSWMGAVRVTVEFVLPEKSK
jgi:hypothetical protein